MIATQEKAATLPLVRAQVRDILERSRAFRSLSPARQQELAHDLVKVGTYITSGETGKNVPGGAVVTNADSRVAKSLADPPPTPPDPKLGTAAKEGTDQFVRLTKEVNFPDFVSGLIGGVFNAIVDSSIKQMEAYGELVKNVAKSVDEYMRDNVSENQARDYLVDRYPSHLELDFAGEQPKVKPKEGADDETMPDFFKELGLSSPVDSLDEDTVEQTLVPAARQRIAMDRQQLLATMVLMGINRLIVTNGTIEASVLFELNTQDTERRHSTTTSDYSSEDKSGYSSKWKSDQKDERSATVGDNIAKANWELGYSGEYKRDQNRMFKMTTVRTSDSVHTIDLHAKLGGKVKVNFRSETFPLERMADMLQMNQIREKAPNMARGGPVGQAAGAPEAAPVGAST